MCRQWSTDYSLQVVFLCARFAEGINMGFSDRFFKALGITAGRGGNLPRFSKDSDIPRDRLKYYNDKNVLPSGDDLKKVLDMANISELELMLKMGRLDKNVIDALQEFSPEIAKIIEGHKGIAAPPQESCSLEFQTKLGKLYKGDCVTLLNGFENDYFDLVFADPPFNLNKLYPSNIDDNLKTEKYIHWCQEWLGECIRTLKPGGSLFLWNLPKWNATLTSYLDSRMSFRHSIAVDIKYSLPIQGRLYPSHYSLLYYVNGEKPNIFHPDRLAMQVCPKCCGDLKDYGGYKNKMNPLGVNLSDIWTDIPPVRHAKYKRREGANELSLKLLDRIIEMSTDEGCIVFDPFGGSGTTYMAAELKGRKWVGCEIGPSDVIVERFGRIEEEREILSSYREKINALFPEKTRIKREKLGLWTCESVKSIT